MTPSASPRPDRVSDTAGNDQAPREWEARPLAALLLRTSLLLLPLLASVAVTAAGYAFASPPSTWLGRITLWVVLFAVGLAVAAGTERMARRFLPVAMLLRMTLVFPDQAPSRFKLMRAAASPHRLQQIAEAGGDTACAAAQVLSLVGQLARHDRHTRGHSERVRVFADLIAEELGLRGTERDKLRWSALLHDVGKMDVPAAILNKPGKPTPEEWAVLQGHPAAALPRVEGLALWLGIWIGGITEHHERWDGKGYPRGLAAEDISLAGRIVAVADAYETMTASRSYKKPMATRAARQELADCAGAHFDARVVRAFLAVSLPRLLWKVGPLSFLLHLPFLGQLQSASIQLTAGVAQAAGTTAVVGLTTAAVVTGGVPSLASAHATAPSRSSHVRPERPAGTPASHIRPPTSSSPVYDVTPSRAAPAAGATAVKPVKPPSPAVAPKPTKSPAPQPTKSVAPKPTKSLAPQPTKSVAPKPTKAPKAKPTTSAAPKPTPKPTKAPKAKARRQGSQSPPRRPRSRTERHSDSPA